MPKASLQNLKNIRLSKSETLNDVAKDIGISEQYYWMIENGQRGLSYELAVKIAKHFDSKPDDIFLKSDLTTG